MAYTHIKPGEELEISGHAYRGESKIGVAELTTLPMEELERLEQASVEKEKAIYQSMCDLLPNWKEQAKETIRVRMAKEYLRILPVDHTANQWKEMPYDLHEVSNMVYKMTWRVYERTTWSRGEQKMVTTGWELTWSLCFNTVANPDNTRTGWQIAGQDRKVFKDKEAMDKYLQGRIAAHAHLFTEISPPIPKGEEGRFSVNGVLLPGYTIEVPELTPQQVADKLLDYLEEDDGKETPAQTSHHKAPAHKQKKHAPSR